MTANQQTLNHPSQPAAIETQYQPQNQPQAGPSYLMYFQPDPSQEEELASPLNRQEQRTNSSYCGHFSQTGQRQWNQIQPVLSENLSQ